MNALVPLVRTATRCYVFAAVTAAFFVAAAATPALAQHARLSADLVDHLAAGSQSIEVIVHGDQLTVDDLARRYGVTVKRRMKSGAVLRVNAGQLDALSRDEEVDHLSGDIKIRPSDVTVQSIGADQLADGVGELPTLSGEGIVVAVIDSGFDTRHHALKGRVRHTEDFTGGNGFDKYGHGTHVAATIAGQAGRTSDTRDYRGVAPGASLINLRVLGDDGSGTASDVIEAIDWAVDHRAQYKIRVINLSLGAPVLQPYRDDPLCEAVERAVRAGIVVVASAGNFGRNADGQAVAGGITSPGISPYAITVGAVDTHGTPWRSDDTLAPYSSLGPTRFDLVLKPDLVAPGSHVVSAEAAGSYLATTLSQRHVVGSGPNAYIQLSGTSMAAGVVSGAVALLLQEKPTLKPATAKAVLQLTSSFMPSAGFVGSGAGSLNVLAAAQFVAQPTSLNSSLFIGGERVRANGLMFADAREQRQIHADHSVLWGQLDTIVWGQAAIIVWSQSDSIVSGQTDTIVWGQSDTIVWGQSDTIVWGQSDTIVWGQSDTIVWGQSDTIVWGQGISD